MQSIFDKDFSSSSFFKEVILKYTRRVGKWDKEEKKKKDGFEDCYHLGLLSISMVNSKMKCRRLFRVTPVEGWGCWDIYLHNSLHIIDWVLLTGLLTTGMLKFPNNCKEVPGLQNRHPFCVEKNDKYKSRAETGCANYPSPAPLRFSHALRSTYLLLSWYFKIVIS